MDFSEKEDVLFLGKQQSFFERYREQAVRSGYFESRRWCVLNMKGSASCHSNLTQSLRSWGSKICLSTTDLLTLLHDMDDCL